MVYGHYKNVANITNGLNLLENMNNWGHHTMIYSNIDWRTNDFKDSSKFEKNMYVKCVNRDFFSATWIVLIFFYNLRLNNLYCSYFFPNLRLGYVLSMFLFFHKSVLNVLLSMFLINIKKSICNHPRIHYWLHSTVLLSHEAQNP